MSKFVILIGAIGIAAFLTIIFTIILLALELEMAYLVIAAFLAATILIFSAVVFQIRDMYKKQTKNLESDVKNMHENQTKQENIHKKILELAHNVVLNSDFDKLLQDILPQIIELTNSACCAFYSLTSATKLSLKHSIGFGKNVYSEFDISMGEGFVGNAAQLDNITIIRDIPEDTIYFVRTFLGKIKPKSLMIVPIRQQEQLNGVLVCASVHSYTEEELHLAETIKYYIGMAIINGISSEKNKRLTNELAFQNRLIQDQHEEMRKRLSDKEQLVQYLVNIGKNDIVFVLGPSCKVLYWDKKAIYIYGLSREEATGRHISNVNSKVGLANIPSTATDATELDGLQFQLFPKENPDDHIRYDLQLNTVEGDGFDGIVATISNVEVLDSHDNLH
ncbi:MAG: GAF domain-containing protein [Defluviitaleaceae bacterium]|nr:GAF domain-containing protein [Defluviitaleaceae bacterium]